MILLIFSLSVTVQSSDFGAQFRQKTEKKNIQQNLSARGRDNIKG